MSSPRSSSDTIRIAILGETGNGKTALVVKLLSGRFIWNYDPTLEGTYKHQLVDGDVDANGGYRVYHLEIIDTAGCLTMDEEQVKLDSYIKAADAFILMYSITDSHSFDAMKTLNEKIVERKKLGTSVAIVANKRDLLHYRAVDMCQGENYARDHANIFYELSVKMDSDLISQPFLDLCKHVSSRKRSEGIKLRRRSSASQLFRKLIQKKLSI